MPSYPIIFLMFFHFNFSILLLFSVKKFIVALTFFSTTDICSGLYGSQLTPINDLREDMQ